MWRVGHTRRHHTRTPKAPESSHAGWPSGVDGAGVAVERARRTVLIHQRQGRPASPRPNRQRDESPDSPGRFTWPTSGAREDDESLGRSGHRDIAVDRSSDALAERLWVDEDDQVELEPLRQLRSQRPDAGRRPERGIADDAGNPVGMRGEPGVEDRAQISSRSVLDGDPHRSALDGTATISHASNHVRRTCS
jgi:hypothetical protein